MAEQHFHTIEERAAGLLALARALTRQHHHAGARTDLDLLRTETARLAADIDAVRSATADDTAADPVGVPGYWYG